MDASRLDIDRLSLEVSGLSADEARRLATLVGKGLAERSVALAPGRVPAVRVQLESRPQQSVGDLAERIVEETLAVLGRTA
ncbi:hypothetical protein XI09_05210 [Bradyrhizobium sp. CCBAU 11386]|uniref:hypothetical protein n=1 Tax=Bradyrhizobium sp. CCBAU 11386 TaxID=1630837 RepID=UPI002302C442|nr:hypothetical protein [Bradyrhizobium sp. CCBAU 11386]MDA9504171.1 hypothetical protein [Bradyrhizobium sp. CCBAU 11386]